MVVIIALHCYHNLPNDTDCKRILNNTINQYTWCVKKLKEKLNNEIQEFGIRY